MDTVEYDFYSKYLTDSLQKIISFLNIKIYSRCTIKRQNNNNNTNSDNNNNNTAELQCLERLWDHRKLFETWVVRATEG